MMTYPEIVEFLTHNKETGEYTGDLHVPGGRFGGNGLDCARVVAALVQANPAIVETDEDYETLMWMVVNSSDDIAYMLNQAGLCIGKEIYRKREKLQHEYTRKD